MGTWDSFWQGVEGGQSLGNDARNSRAYQEGGLPALIAKVRELAA